MPRKPRLDRPGLLHHVMGRGIEGRAIFSDNQDRLFFLERIGSVLNETKTTCFAYALIPNHFHLLLKTGPKPIATTMRRLLTSYAVYFNKKNKRNGYLFQNRYKDIVCQEEAYLLELVRYINLNPLRAGVVLDVKQLNNFKFCSHNLLIKNSKPLKWFGKDEILSLFAKTERKAIKVYQQFIFDGMDIPEKPELEGGGLKRSYKNTVLGPKMRVAFDDRILGESDFVVELTKHEEKIIRRDETSIDLNNSIAKALKIFNVNEAQLISSSRLAHITNVRAVITYIGTQELGISAAAIARRLCINKSSAIRLIEKGRQITQEIK